MKVPEYGRDATKGIATAMSMSFSMPPNLVLFLWMMLTKYGTQSLVWRFNDVGRPEYLTWAVAQAGQFQGLQEAALRVRLWERSLAQCCTAPCSGAPAENCDNRPSKKHLVRRYGVVTCYSMQMFIFMIFVGMVLSGSYPVVCIRCAA